MTKTWHSATPPEHAAIPPLGWVLVGLRAVPLVVLVFGGLALLLLVRVIEAPLFGARRPATPHITQFVCRNALRILGIGLRITGTPMRQRGAIVANHTSWLDIFSLNACKRIYFVSKSEVAGWPGIGWLARATGTVFIERNPARAVEQTKVFESRLLAGHKLLFFPEGTSTDGLQVLPFKTTLFQAFFTPALCDQIAVQPVTVHYTAPPGREGRFYGWWGDMTFGAHLLATLAPWRQGHVTVCYGTPLKVADFADRKTLAQACEDVIRTDHARLSAAQP